MTVDAEPSGLLDVCRFAPRRITGEAELVYARIFLEAEEDEVRQFSFGYSDIANVFLNGRPALHRQQRLSLALRQLPRDHQPRGRRHLPLQKGRNELMFMVVETFGGWGTHGSGQRATTIMRDEHGPELWEQQTQLAHARIRRLRPEPATFSYVSSFFTGGSREFVSKIKLDGDVADREWITGSDATDGISPSAETGCGSLERNRPRRDRHRGGRRSSHVTRFPRRRS